MIIEKSTFKLIVIVLIISLGANVILGRIILNPSEPRQNHSAIIDLIEEDNERLMMQNDDLKGRIYLRDKLIDSIKQSIADQKPQIIYINKKVDEVHDSNLTDSVIIILKASLLARDTIWIAARSYPNE